MKCICISNVQRQFYYKAINFAFCMSLSSNENECCTHCCLLNKKNPLLFHILCFRWRKKNNFISINLQQRIPNNMHTFQRFPVKHYEHFFFSSIDVIIFVFLFPFSIFYFNILTFFVYRPFYLKLIDYNLIGILTGVFGGEIG